MVTVMLLKGSSWQGLCGVGKASQGAGQFLSQWLLGYLPMGAVPLHRQEKLAIDGPTMAWAVDERSLGFGEWNYYYLSKNDGKIN